MIHQMKNSELSQIGFIMSDKNKRRSRGGGREARRELRSSQAQNTINKPYIKRNIPVYDLVSDEVCELIENNAEIILEEIGIDFRDDKEALSILKSMAVM